MSNLVKRLRARKPYDKLQQEAADEIEKLLIIITKTKSILRQHHEWHQQEGLEMKLGDEYFDVASNYCDSSLEEETSSALWLGENWK